MSFSNFLKTIDEEKITPRESDFINDWMQDPNKPYATTRGKVVYYLQTQGACEGAIEGFKSLWERHEKTKRI